MKLRFLAAAGASVLLLTGCQADPPGSAAVIDGTSISMASADDAAQVYCRLTLASAQQQGVNAVSNSAVRRQAVSDLVLAEVADEVARERGLEVPTSAYTLTPAQRANIAKAVPAVDATTAADVVEKSQRTFVIATLVGEQQLGKELDVTKGTDDIQSAGLDVLTQRLKESKVRYDPRFGLTRSGTARADLTGSLSVAAQAASSDDDGADLPATQRCV